jgi:archaellum biogenesis protein FlaJ (TadC family)
MNRSKYFVPGYFILENTLLNTKMLLNVNLIQTNIFLMDLYPPIFYKHQTKQNVNLDITFFVIQMALLHIYPINIKQICTENHTQMYENE